MWGNRLGWSISVVIVAIFAFVGYLIVRGGRTTPPTALSLSDPVINQPLAMPIDPATIVAMDQAGVAGPLYRQAIDDYLANPGLYERLLTNRDPDLQSLLPGQQALIDATHLAQMDLFARFPDQVISYTSALPQLDALARVAQSLNLLGQRNQHAGDTQRAISYFQATFTLGARLFSEGVSYPEVSVGLGMMATAGGQLEKLEPERAGQIRAFREAYADYAGKLQEAQRKINSMDRKISYRHTGDVYRIARDQNVARLWRVEALLKLGRIRFDANPYYPGDQRSALPTVKKYLNDPDPAIKSAAQLAADLTEIQFRKLGS
ncbi:MAG: hypothetical protein IT448_07490 [Phycisphaerales bacterium]|nr:hypothetical protein [Phycisphaerales bacterium]